MISSKEALMLLIEYTKPSIWKDGFRFRNLKTHEEKTTEEIFDIIYDDLNHLEQLENIEEELGVDLITLFKALRDGVFINEDGYLYKDYIKTIEHWPDCWGFVSNDEDIEVFFEDYGNIWALTSEELEDGCNNTRETN